MNIIVNGGTRGIGKEVVMKLSGNKENLILATGRNSEALRALTASGQYRNIISCKLDMLSFNSYEAALTEVLHSRVKNVDILINIAGLLIRKDFVDLSSGEALKMIQTNFLGPAALIRVIRPFMHKGSHIVNISSMGGYQGSQKYKGLSYYSASKAAISCLSECLATEFKEDGIVVNCLALGSADTEMFREAFPGYEASVTAHDMAAFITDFALNGSKFFNGKVLPVALTNP
jgi:short-subunit dehydrogenase